eukprot:SAG22_NODE_2587_length_2410_cov_4.925573_2_plen_193_part_00
MQTCQRTKREHPPISTGVPSRVQTKGATRSQPTAAVPIAVCAPLPHPQQHISPSTTAGPSSAHRTHAAVCDWRKSRHIVPLYNAVMVNKPRQQQINGAHSGIAAHSLFASCGQLPIKWEWRLVQELGLLRWFLDGPIKAKQSPTRVVSVGVGSVSSFGSNGMIRHCGSGRLRRLVTMLPARANAAVPGSAST